MKAPYAYKYKLPLLFFVVSFVLGPASVLILENFTFRQDLHAAAPNVPTLKIFSGLPNDSPKAPFLELVAKELGERINKNIELVFLGEKTDTIAAVKTAIAPPNGLFMGNLSLDIVITRSLEELGPYLPTDFLPIVLYETAPPVIIVKESSVIKDFLSLKDEHTDTPVSLLTISIIPIPESTLLALDALKALRIHAELITASALKDPTLNPYVLAFHNLNDNQLLAVPYDTLEELQEKKLGFRVICHLGTKKQYDSLPNIPNNLSLEDLGLKRIIKPISGFFFPIETSGTLAEDTPIALYTSLNALLSEKNGFIENNGQVKNKGSFENDKPLTNDLLAKEYQDKNDGNKNNDYDYDYENSPSAENNGVSTVNDTTEDTSSSLSDNTFVEIAYFPEGPILMGEEALNEFNREIESRLSLLESYSLLSKGD